METRLMSSATFKSILSSILLVAQVLSSSAVPAFGQCAVGQCRCSFESRQSGTCCCGTKSSSGSCCHAKRSASKGQTQVCQCGCQDDSRPATPDPRQSNSHERLLRIAAQPLAVIGHDLAADPGPQTKPHSSHMSCMLVCHRSLSSATGCSKSDPIGARIAREHRRHP